MKTISPLKKILYVEDDRFSLLLIAHMLRDKYDIDGAENAETAFEMVLENRYDLILMDIRLGPVGKSGLELVHDIRQLPYYKVVPVIAVTAYAMAGDRENILKNGCDDYVAKPINFKILNSAILNQLKSSTHSSSLLNNDSSY